MNCRGQSHCTPSPNTNPCGLLWSLPGSTKTLPINKKSPFLWTQRRPSCWLKIRGFSWSGVTIGCSSRLNRIVGSFPTWCTRSAQYHPQSLVLDLSLSNVLNTPQPVANQTPRVRYLPVVQQSTQRPFLNVALKKCMHIVLCLSVSSLSAVFFSLLSYLFIFFVLYMYIFQSLQINRKNSPRRILTFYFKKIVYLILVYTF
jgi:hypothetical protein